MFSWRHQPEIKCQGLFNAQHSLAICNYLVVRLSTSAHAVSLARPWQIALNLCGAPPDTPPFASYSVHTQTEVEATLAIGFSGKGSIVSLVWLDILDRRPSRKRCCFQCASINLLERENVHRIATKESPCADVIAIQFARCQIKYCKTKRTCY